VAQRLHQQPGGVAAGAARLAERLLRRPDARLHADDIGDAVLDLLVQRDEHVDGALPLPARDAGEEAGEQGPRRLGTQEGGELGRQHRVVGEGPGLRVGLEEKVEGVDRRHVGDEVHRDVEPRHPPGEDHAGLEIALRVLLPVDEMGLGLDLQRVGDDRRAGMRRRAQPDHLRAERDGAVVPVGGAVGQGDVQRHGGGCLGRGAVRR
jgi:hypothetical protein